MNATIKQAIENLAILESQVEKVSNSEKYYNTDYGQFLANWSFEMHKMKNEIIEHTYVIGF